MKEKIFSARFWVTIMLTGVVTYCLAMEIVLPEWFIVMYTTDVILYFFRPDRAKMEMDNNVKTRDREI